GNFTQIRWAEGPLFIQIDVDINNSGTFVAMGSSQILSVPYALYSGNSLDSEPGTEGQTLTHTGEKWVANSTLMAGSSGVTINASQTKNRNTAIFAVRNVQGDTVFAVYENEVRIMINDDPSYAAKGGFAIGGVSAMKNNGVEYFKVTPDSSFVHFNVDSTKAAKGGFAIGGVSAGKSVVKPYFSLDPTLVSFNFDIDAAKRAARGGFAIGGVSAGKETNTEFFTLNADSIRFYIDTDETKAAKGGFAIGGVSAGKTPGDKYFSLKPELIQFSFDDTSSNRAARGGFAIGGLAAGKSNPKNYFELKPDSVTFAMNETGTKGVKGAFTVGTLSPTLEYNKLFNVDKDCTYIANTIYSEGDMYVGGNINIGGSITSFITDVDGNIYPVVKVGVQEWLGKNLMVTRYNNGNPIIDSTTSANLYKSYQFNPGEYASPAIYGYLYDQGVMYSGNQICPTGWRLPVEADWVELLSYATSTFPDDTTSLLSNQFPWTTITEQVTNSTGFGAIPAGNFSWTDNIDDANYSLINTNGFYWIQNTPPMFIKFPNGEFNNIQTGVNSGYSIRCIKQ
ncbi:MAG TPA: FISUMP domain-containing protein, partial [Salinivirgaceae bacterium]|nr:FISUMP domain-containing protein [Salinivirgaceae bacterium]